MSDSFRADDSFQPPPELLEAWHSIPEIVKIGYPTLRQVAQPVARITREIRDTVEVMMDIMERARGLGLAAPQIGLPYRLFIYNMGEGVKVMINPELLELTGEQLGPEGCLSIPGLIGDVPRANELRIKAYDIRGRMVSRKVSELEARVIQHENDHLDGVLFIDKAIPETLEWHYGSTDEDNAESDEREPPKTRHKKRRRGK